MAIKDERKILKTKRRRCALNADDPAIPSTGNPSLTDPAPSISAEPPAFRRTDEDGDYGVFKSRWIQYCEADFAALPAAMQTRFVTEVLGTSVPSGDTSRPVSPPSPPFSVQVAEMMAAIPMHAIGPEQINARNAALLREENEVIARYVAHQRGYRAREAAEARAAQEERSRRRAGGR